MTSLAPTPAGEGNAASASARPSASSAFVANSSTRGGDATGSIHQLDSGGGDADRAGSLVERSDGMRREWNFALTFRHRSARLALQCSPQWEPTFIDPETIENITQLDRDVAHCPLLPVLRYTDLSAVVAAGAAGGSTNIHHAAMGVRSSVVSAPGSASPSELGRDSLSLGLTVADSEEGGGGGGGEWWVEKAKYVESWYAHLAPDATLASFCRGCVQHILKDPLVVSIDGDSNLTRLIMGQKLACPFLLGGRHRSFHFRLRFHDRSQLMNDAAYAVGTIVHQRGYLFLVRCSEEEELDGYLRRLFLPHFTNAAKLSLDLDISHHPLASVALAEQQELFGELAYEDRDAAVAFSLPMYPMRFRPDFSPAKTVGVGSIACMTLELGVAERVFEDAVVAEVTGMPKYKVNQVVLCLDVEDVTRMGYPNVLSTREYSELKMKRLLEIFPDANLVSQQPTTVMLGGKAGCSYTATFSYEPMQCVAKAMLVTTLVDGHGVTALFLTRLGGGTFDAYLYLFEQLLGSTRFLPHSSHQASLRLSRHRAPNVRLLDTDLPFVYGGSGGAIAAAAAAALSPTTPAGDGDGETKEGGNEEEMRQQGQVGTPVQHEGHEGTAVVVAAAAATTRATAAVTNPYGQARRNKVLERHLRLMREAANDGKVPEGAVVLQVAPELGGLPRHRANSAAGAGAGASSAARRRTMMTTKQLSGIVPGSAAAPSSADGLVAGGGECATNADAGHSSTITITTTTDRCSAAAVGDGLAGGVGAAAAAAGVGAPVDNGSIVAGADYFGNEDARPTATRSGSLHVVGMAGFGSVSVPDGTSTAELDLAEVSLHSDSLISISGIPRLEDARRQAEEVLAAEAVATSSALVEEKELLDTSTGVSGRGPASGEETARHHPSPRPSINSTSRATDDDGVGSAGRHSLDYGPFCEPPDGPFSSASTPSLHQRRTASIGAGQGRDSETHLTASSPFHASTLADGDASAAAAAAEEARIRNILAGGTDDGAGTHAQSTPYLVGPALRDVYIRCCDLQHCRPNSYLLKKLPTNSQFTNSVDEIDLTSNYLGHNGFVAVLNLLEHLPRLQRVYFNDMALDNTDVEHLCEALARHPSITAVELKNNTKITLPSTRFFTRLLRVNPNITRLSLEGTRIGEGIVAKLEKEAQLGRERAKPPQQQQQQQQKEEGGEGTAEGEDAAVAAITREGTGDEL